jgi:hypothetical protein
MVRPKRLNTSLASSFNDPVIQLHQRPNYVSADLLIIHDATICAVIRRWQNLTGRDAVRVSDGKLFRDIEAEKEEADEY